MKKTRTEFLAGVVLLAFAVSFAGANEVPDTVHDNYTTIKDTLLIVAAPGVLGNDSDPEGATLIAIQSDDPGNGTLTLNADGSFTYQPNAGFLGTDDFFYLAFDGTTGYESATVTITVVPNTPPVAEDDTYATNQDTQLNVTAPGVLGNDWDVDGGPLFVDITSATNPPNGSVVINSDGSFTYTPDPGFYGLDYFDYTVEDEYGSADSATVTITVTEITTITVDIDIKPGSSPNSINQGSNGVIPVAILSSDTFDATTVDPATVELGGASVAVRGKADKSLAHLEDVNGDGLVDLMVQVETQGLDDLGAGGTVELTGTTFSGEDIVGYDDVVIVPPE